ncbi:MAG: hypothetical protein M3268_03770 [Acidobacteriota bacterium]|nr:hypothetical protein [Acidobacteriota bacterium]
MNVRSLSTTEELRLFIDFGQTVYRDNPHWVPPDPQHMTRMLTGQSAYGPQSQVQAFCVEEGGDVLATVAALRDEAYNRHWGEQLGHLLFFEALPEKDEAVASLMSAACDWLRERGSRAVRLSMLPGWQLPLTIDAYDATPTIFHTYNPAYYHSYVKNAGFATERGVVQYQVRFTPELAARYREMIERATSSGVALRSFDFERLEEETETFAEVFNDTFKTHWSFMPMTVAAMRGLTVELKDFLVAEFTGYAEVEGETAGVVYSLPDLNQAFHAMRGRDIGANFGEFMQRLAEIDHGVLLVIGVREGQRGRGVNLALAAKSFLAMIERGYKTASYTVVLDDNWPSRRTAERLGARVTRNFNVYRKELA